MKERNEHVYLHRVDKLRLERKFFLQKSQMANREAVIRASQHEDESDCISPLQCIVNIIKEGMMNPDIAAAFAAGIVIVLLSIKFCIRWRLCL